MSTENIKLPGSATKLTTKERLAVATVCAVFLGLHVGWHYYHIKYVPESQRHDHPVVKWYKKYYVDKAIVVPSK